VVSGRLGVRGEPLKLPSYARLATQKPDGSIALNAEDSYNRAVPA
jgi:hypothetical protein